MPELYVEKDTGKPVGVDSVFAPNEVGGVGDRPTLARLLDHLLGLEPCGGYAFRQDTDDAKLIKAAPFPGYLVYEFPAEMAIRPLPEIAQVEQNTAVMDDGVEIALLSLPDEVAAIAPTAEPDGDDSTARLWLPELTVKQINTLPFVGFLMRF